MESYTKGFPDQKGRIRKTILTSPTMTFRITLSVLCITSFFCSHAQHAHHTEKSENPLQFAAVLSQKLSDPELKDYKVDSSVLTIAPGGVDTVSHRHDCELFGYVLAGDVEIALTTKDTKVYHTGQMFYEARNVLHTITHNPHKKQQTRILLFFIIKEGRAGYTQEYVR